MSFLYNCNRPSEIKMKSNIIHNNTLKCEILRHKSGKVCASAITENCRT